MANQPFDMEIDSQVYKNLLQFIYQKCPFYPHAVFKFLITYKKEIIQLLTNGNLDTVYHKRELK